MIFVDTGAWFARFVPGDPQHNRFVTWFAANNDPLVTTNYCVDETLTLLLVREHAKLAVEAGVQLFAESLATIHFLTRNQVERAWILFQQRSRAGWSFTDCTSKIAIDDLNITAAVALDRHVAQFGVSILP